MNQTVALQLFAYDEAGVIRPTMDAYASVDTPEGVSVDYQGWVTPTRSRRTLREVEQHDTFVARQAPEGKLSARNLAHDRATRQGYDIIVTADADEPPATEDYLQNLLTPILDGRAAATSGLPKETGALGPAFALFRRLDQARGPIRANCSAFTTGAWRAAGPFDASTVSQTDIGSVRPEEEFDYRRRIESYGPVEDVYDARTIANNRRTFCRLQEATNPVGGAREGYCSRRGEATFSPLRGRNDK